MPQRKNLYPAARVRTNVTCRRCGAAKGEPCWTWEEQPRSMHGCHRARHLDYERKMGRKPQRGVKGMSVRFVCPVCGGPHSRAEHPVKAQKPPATGTGGFNEG